MAERRIGDVRLETSYGLALNTATLMANPQ